MKADRGCAGMDEATARSSASPGPDLSVAHAVQQSNQLLPREIPRPSPEAENQLVSLCHRLGPLLCSSAEASISCLTVASSRIGFRLDQVHQSNQSIVFDSSTIHADSPPPRHLATGRRDGRSIEIQGIDSNRIQLQNRVPCHPRAIDFEASPAQRARDGAVAGGGGARIGQETARARVGTGRTVSAPQ